MTRQLPDPLVPREVDLRGYEFMPFFGDILLGSRFNTTGNDTAWRIGVTLWWRSWNNQVPAASLPDDDSELAMLAGLGRDVRTFKKVREAALHGFIKCSDGRLYHRFLAAKAIDAWQGRKAHKDRTVKARIAALEKRLLGALTDDERARINALLHDLRQSLSLTPATKPVTGDKKASDRPPEVQGEERRGEVKESGTSTESAHSNASTGPEAERARLTGNERDDPEMQSARMRGVISAALREEGVNITSGDPFLTQWVQLGVTVPIAREALDRARNHKPKPERIPAKYLDPIVLEVLNEAKCSPRISGTPALGLEWWTTAEGIFAKAVSESVEIAMRRLPDGQGVRDQLVTLARLCVRLGPGSWVDSRNGTLLRLIHEIEAEQAA